jgi:phenylalanyl-tRNA synthetase alpha chain
VPGGLASLQHAKRRALIAEQTFPASFDLARAVTGGLVPFPARRSTVTRSRRAEAMPQQILSPEAVAHALAVRDLTDPAQGPHAVQQVLGAAVAALAGAWGCPARIERAHPVIPVADNYDRLHYRSDGAARDARYTRYVSSHEVLRTQTSAMIPRLLRRLAREPHAPADVLLACPGVVYRRDAIDRLHAAEPHQLDLWRVRRGAPLGPADLDELIARVAAAVAPGRELRAVPAEHPYTVAGRQLDVRVDGAWVEIGECGLALPALLAEAGLPEDATGLAMGLGLDRLVMIAKGLPDIRLLRATDPRIAAQLADLAPWRPVSRHPPVRRDLSVAVDGAAGAEDLGDRVREALGPRADGVEAVEVLSETPCEALPAAACARMGMAPGQKNVLLRVTLRALGRTLTDAEANALRDAIYAAVHRGTAHEWAVAGAAAAP